MFRASGSTAVAATSETRGSQELCVDGYSGEVVSMQTDSQQPLGNEPEGEWSKWDLPCVFIKAIYCKKYIVFHYCV